MLATLFIACMAWFALAYIFYGRFLEKRLGVDPVRRTPAYTHHDGVDYVPTATPILFGHHFSSIAGAGPIVGPVIAGLAFGWLPAILWVLIGAVFIGGTHDYVCLIASLHNKGRSVGQMARQLLSPASRYLFLVFIWLTMIYIQIVFLDLTASTFAPLNPLSGAMTDAAQLQVSEGGTVATASILYICLALVFGVTIYRFRIPVWLGTLIFVPLVFGALYVGHLMPLSADMMPVLFGSPKNTWLAILIAYCFMASVLPVWVLLQPRDYLSSFLLYACLFGGGVGLIVSGFTGRVAIQYPSLVTFSDANLKFMFPALFVTIACGAVSGFHAIVASGTTAKQLRSESSARPVAYGSMLVEGVLAIIALAAVMILAAKPKGHTPVSVFADGLGYFVNSLGIDRRVAVTFGLLAVSTFLLTTLDTCTRLSRFIFEEIFHVRGLAARLGGTVAALLIPALVVFRQIPGPGGKLLPAWQAIWPAFGATNQLMAALALLVVFAWLRSQGKRALYVLIPMVFMCITTLTALGQLVYRNFMQDGSYLVGVLSLILSLLAIALIVDAMGRLRKSTSNAEHSTQNPSPSF